MGVGDPGICRRFTTGRIVIGDPGLLSAIRKIGGQAASFVPGGGLARTGAQATARFVRGAPARQIGMTSIAPQPGLVSRALNLLPNITPAQARRGGLAVTAAALGGLGLTGIGQVIAGRAAAPMVAGGMMFPRRRRRINVANAKALRRATSRVAGFHKLAVRIESSLSHLVRRRTRGVRARRK